MNDIFFVVMFCLVAAIGAISIVFVRIGIRGITDKLIRSLFNYVLAMILSLVSISLLFVIWMSSSDHLFGIDKASSGLLIYLFIVSIFIIVLGSALAVKQTGDLYGFRIKEKIGALKSAKKK